MHTVFPIGPEFDAIREQKFDTSKLQLGLHEVLKPGFAYIVVYRTYREMERILSSSLMTSMPLPPLVVHRTYSGSKDFPMFYVRYAYPRSLHEVADFFKTSRYQLRLYDPAGEANYRMICGMRIFDMTRLSN